MRCRRFAYTGVLHTTMERAYSAFVVLRESEDATGGDRGIGGDCPRHEGTKARRHEGTKARGRCTMRARHGLTRLTTAALDKVLAGELPVKAALADLQQTVSVKEGEALRTRG